MPRGRKSLKDTASELELDGIDRKTTLQSTERVLSIIETLARSSVPLSSAELGAKLGVQRTTIYSLVNKAVALDWVDKDEDSGKFSISSKMYELSRSYPSRLAIVKTAMPHMRDLATEFSASVRLQYYNKDYERIILSEFREPTNITNSYVMPDTRAPLHAASSGKLLCSTLPDEQFRAALARFGMTKYTEETTTDPDQLALELEKIRSVGYAVDRGEYLVIHMGVSFPIWNPDQSLACILTLNGMRKYIEEHFESIVESGLWRSKMISMELAN